MLTVLCCLPAVLALAVFLFAGSLAAATDQQPTQTGTNTQASPAQPLLIYRTKGPIVVDGQLGDPGWIDSEPITTWFETNPGDNLPPKVDNVAYLAYDDEYLYAGFEFDDPQPHSIRAPLANRDDVPGDTDYGGLIIDASDDGSTAQMFLANPRGIQYDAISSDASGEDSSPDYFWDSAARITDRGWVLELRIPFASLRYSDPNPAKWGILLYRNQPREFRYQMFSSRLPRGVNCFICNVRPLVGLTDLPVGGHWVLAPYATAQRSSRPSGALGTSLDNTESKQDLGLDAKWLPNPNLVFDATLHPDFSQVEADVAQIAANERFALFFPEKRPFFLEGVDLFSTPIRAVFTRSFSQPRWGARATGSLDGNSFTVLAGEDAGGGSVILPGANSSSLARQDFTSTVGIARFRRDFGQSFVSALYSGREIEGGAHNRVLGTDFRWQPSRSNVVDGQLLFSNSRTPQRPDLADEWDGRELSDRALELRWRRSTSTWDHIVRWTDIGQEFRADNGFLPQVGFRRSYAEVGRSLHPVDKPITRLRTFAFSNYTEDQNGRLLARGVTPGFGFDSLLSSFVRFELAFENIRGIERIHRRQQVRAIVDLQPSRVFSRVNLSATLGDEIDFANDRAGRGATLGLSTSIRPTNHLELALNANRQRLDVVDEQGRSGRLFTADVGRLRATYTFTARSWLRLIGQWVETERRPDLYTFDVDAHQASFSGSLVFAYKLNWQTVLFAGWGDDRATDPNDTLQRADQQVFVKVSYAFRK